MSNIQPEDMSPPIDDRRSRMKAQSNTFPHLGTGAALTYNWVKLSTELECEGARPEFADQFQSINPALLELIAESPSVSERTLSVLAFHRSARVRQAVADNARTPVAILLLLATDENIDVRFALAENHNMPEEVLDILKDDENPYVRMRAATTWANRKARG